MQVNAFTIKEHMKVVEGFQIFHPFPQLKFEFVVAGNFKNGKFNSIRGFNTRIN